MDHKAMLQFVKKKVEFVILDVFNQIDFYKRYRNIVIINTTSKTNQFDMMLLLVIVVDNNFRNLIIAAAILEDETEAIFL